jgi:hypothetical protein
MLAREFDGRAATTATTAATVKRFADIIIDHRSGDCLQTGPAV